jgi:hypothetical protein
MWSTTAIAMTTTYQILYWHDIPLQVRARGPGRERANVQLAARFQEAVDQAAMAAGLIGDDAYTAGFRWGEPQPYAGTAQEAARAVAAELEAAQPAIDWRRTALALRGGPPS